MLGLWLEDRRLSLRDDLPDPVPADGEALIDVLLAGICNTDLELRRGYYPFAGVPGHEFVGRVAAGPEALLGRRVVGGINAVCGRCATCRAGRPTHCERRTVLGIVGRDGAFAERLTLPVANLVPVPDDLPDEAAVFAEPLAAALRVLEQVPIGADDRVLVVGDGKLGQLIARVLLDTRARVAAVGRHPRKLALLGDAGVETLDAEGAPVAAFDVAVECTGRPEGFDIARRAVRPRGTLVLKSTYAGALTLDVSSLVVDEITLVGSRCGPMETAVERLAAGTIDPRPLIDDRFPLAAGLAAFDRAATPGVMKVLVGVAADRNPLRHSPGAGLES